MNSEYKLGFTTQYGREGCTHPHGSWRRGRACLVQKPVDIVVYVLMPTSICKKKGLKGQFFYVESRSYPEGEVTLGGIIDQLEEIRSRTYKAHFRRSEELGEDWVSSVTNGFYNDCGEDDEGNEDSDEEGEDRKRDEKVHGKAKAGSSEVKDRQSTEKSVGDPPCIAGLSLQG